MNQFIISLSFNGQPEIESNLFGSKRIGLCQTGITNHDLSDAIIFVNDKGEIVISRTGDTQITIERSGRYRNIVKNHPVMLLMRDIIWFGDDFNHRVEIAKIYQLKQKKASRFSKFSRNALFAAGAMILCMSSACNQQQTAGMPEIPPEIEVENTDTANPDATDKADNNPNQDDTKIDNDSQNLKNDNDTVNEDDKKGEDTIENEENKIENSDVTQDKKLDDSIAPKEEIKKVDNNKKKESKKKKKKNDTNSTYAKNRILPDKDGRCPPGFERVEHDNRILCRPVITGL